MFTNVTTAGAGEELVYKLLVPAQKSSFQVISKKITIYEEEKEIGGTVALLEFAKYAQENDWNGPADLSVNHDKYFIEAWEKDHKGK